MSVKTSIWKVSPEPELLIETALEKEQVLEDMIVAAPSVLSDEWMLVGQQEDTGSGGRIDLLALAPDQSLVLIELKRDRTPREVVAQALDYACWVDKLDAADLARIYGKFAPGKDLGTEFKERFGYAIDEDSLNESHQIIIVAASLDESTERIVAYLGERNIPINVLCFQIFEHGGEQLLSRSWLLDPTSTQSSASNVSKGDREPWNGEFYCSFGDGGTRSWNEAVEFGFICAGGGAWYSRTLHLLNPDDRVWVRIPGKGFVGVGRVTGRAVSASDFKVLTEDGERLFMDIKKRGTYHEEHLASREKCEYFIPIQWLQTVPIESAVSAIGLFGNQNTICKPTAARWRSTVTRLMDTFTKYKD